MISFLFGRINSAFSYDFPFLKVFLVNVKFSFLKMNSNSFFLAFISPTPISVEKGNVTNTFLISSARFHSILEYSSSSSFANLPLLNSVIFLKFLLANLKADMYFFCRFHRMANSPLWVEARVSSPLILP